MLLDGIIFSRNKYEVNSDRWHRIATISVVRKSEDYKKKQLNGIK